MWVIVAVTLGFTDQPKLHVTPGAEFKTEAECVQATHVRAHYDSENGGGNVAFSFCVPKGSVEIGGSESKDPL